MAASRVRWGLIPLAWRFLRARPLRLVLSALSVALGVGLVAALITLNATATRAVDAAIERVRGPFDLAVGYREPGTFLSAADLEVIAAEPGVTQVMGILIPYLGDHRPELPPDLVYYGVPDFRLHRWFMLLTAGSFPGPGEVALSADWAQREGYMPGDVIHLPFPPHGTRAVRVSGLLGTSPLLPFGAAVFPRAWLEEVTGRYGATFALVDVADPDQAPLVAAGLQERFPGLDIDLGEELREMRRNLHSLRPLALGLGIAALLSAAFLVAAAFHMALSERVRELALLRAVGATPAQVRRLMLAEGAMVGAAGAVPGALLGALTATLAAGGAVQALGADPVPAVWPWGPLMATAAAGILVAVLAAGGVARAAARTEPVRALRPDLAGAEAASRQGGRLGIAMILAGTAVLAGTPLWPDGAAAGGLPALSASTGALAVALGLILGMQRLLPPVVAALTWPLRGRPVVAVAARTLLRHRHRSSLTVAALALAAMLVMAAGTMGTTLTRMWLAQIRRDHPADIQVEVPRIYPHGASPELAAAVAAIPEVEAVATVRDSAHAHLVGYDWSRAHPDYLRQSEELDRRYPSQFVPWRARISLSPADLPALIRMGAYRLVEGSLDRWHQEESLAITRRTARDFGLRVGDQVRLNVRQGPLAETVRDPLVRTFTVVAVVETDVSYLPDWLVPAPLPGASDRVRTLFATVAAGHREAARDAVRRLINTPAYSLARYSDLESATQELRRQLRERAALLAAAVVVMVGVAAMGLTGTVATGVTERRRELAVLRAVGATPAQTRNLVLTEAGLLGLVGAAVGVTGGTVLGVGALLGLDVPPDQWRIPWAVGAALLAGGIALGLLAAAAPARRVVRLTPGAAVRVEP